jgi:hypothetical protein
VAGLVLLPVSAAAILVTALTGRRPEARGKLVYGSLVQLVGCAALLLDFSSPIWLLVVIGTVSGIPGGSPPMLVRSLRAIRLSQTSGIE